MRPYWKNKRVTRNPTPEPQLQSLSKAAEMIEYGNTEVTRFWIDVK